MAGMLLAGDASADWPSARHDQHRTGAATGISDIITPGAYWRTYLGGRLGLAEAMPLLVSGETATAFVTSGRVVVTRPNGVPIWSSNNLSVISLVARVDLNGDGALEIVAQSSSQVFAFDLATGELQWSEPFGEMGTLGAVRATDIDGDGLADVLVEECTCCRLNSGDTGYVYSFAEGFSTPQRVWRLPSAFCGGGASLLVDDIDGDGDRDVVLGGWSELQILDGATGVVVATTPSLGTWIGRSWCDSVDLDEVPGKELVCVHGTELEAAGAGHRMFALGFRTGPARLEVLWSTDVGDRDEAIAIGADFLRDLDGDGTIEATVTGTLASGLPQTQIVDAHTGEMLAALNGEVVVGNATLTSRSVIITRAEDRVSAWTFQRGSTPLTMEWRIENRRALVTRDWALSGGRPLSSKVLLADVDTDGERDLLTVNTKLPWEMPVHSLVSPTGATAGTFVAAIGAEVLAGWGPDAELLTISTSDGRLTTMRTTLELVGSIRAGGYYASGAWGDLAAAPVTADLDGDEVDEILISDSRRTLLALDARSGTNAAPPIRRWERTGSRAPSIVMGLGTGGTPGVACRRSTPDATPPVEMVSAVELDGSTRWEVPVGTQIFNDVLAGDLDGDPVPDLVVQWGEADDTAVRTSALAGSDGHTLWTTVTQAGETRFPSGAALTDWDADGVDDVVFHHYGTRVLSGSDGSQIAFGGPTLVHYFMPTIVEVTGEGRPEVTLHGGFHPSETLTSDLGGTVWASSDDDRPYPYAAVTTCPVGPVLVGSSLAHSARLKVTLQAGTPGAWQSVVLAGGSLYLDEAAATAAGAPLTSQLTSIHIHSNLTGHGRPSAVVGSSDGWLYSIDPCTLTLDFAMPFDVPVGAVAFGDGDGDGLDEIFVSTADGFLHGVKQAPLRGPSGVRDVDPAGGSDQDVDEIDTRGSLSAAWDEVDGAIGYEVTVALAEGGIIIEPAWQLVDSTFVTFADLPLDEGVRYVFSVRALSDAGPSPDTLSDGVLVHLIEDPARDGGAGPDANGPGAEQPGGCCQVRDPRDHGGVAVLTLMVLVMLRARRGRRR